MSDGILEEMTMEEVRDFRPEVVVFGIGSVEPHGPALPYGTDYFQGDAIVRRGVLRANAQGARALMYPTLPIGNNVNFKAFPFACRIRVQTLMQVVLDIVEALEEDGIRKIVIYNAHGGNTDTLRATLRAQSDRRRPGQGAFVIMASNMFAHTTRSPFVKHPSDHGGESETSAVMHLRPELVKKGKLAKLAWGQLAVDMLNDPGLYFVRPWHLHVPAGAGGEARESTPEKGKGLIDASAEQLGKLLTALSKATWNEYFPYKGPAGAG